MRIRRLLVEGYRGIDRREVEFLPAGVTVIQGPNEVGKSSLAEAIDILLEFHDSSTDRRVKAVKPVHADAPCIIEADIDIGDHSFTYRKRFFKSRGTVLEINAPRRVNLTGREAHDYVKELLKRHLDDALWRAVKVRQGEQLAQADVASARSLAAALDQAAGVSAAGEGEAAIIDRARDERARYFTPSGRDGAALRDVDEELEAARVAVEKHEEALRDLEHAVVECEGLERTVASLGARLGAAETQLEARQAAWAVVLERTDALQRLRLELDAARSRRDEVAGRVDVRRRLVDEEAAIRARMTESHDAVERWSKAIERVHVQHRAAAARLDELRATEAEARTEFEVAQADFEYRRDEFDLELLRERRARIALAIEDQASANEIVSSVRVDEELLRDLRGASIDLRAAYAAVDAVAPTLRIGARVRTELRIDREVVVVEAGSVVTRSAVRPTQVELGDVEIAMEPGATAETARGALAEAHARLDRLLAEAGVADVAAAERAFEDRAGALRRDAEADRVVEENLRDLALDEMEAKIAGLDRLVERYSRGRSAGFEIAPTLEEARKRRDEAASRMRRAEDESRTAAESCGSLAAELASLQLQEQEARWGSDAAAAQLAAIDEDLQQHRSLTSDEALGEEMAAAGRAFAGARAAYEAEQDSLQRLNPDTIRELAEQAETAVAQTRAALSAEQERLRDLRASLKARGEHGLHEKLHAARARFAHAKTAQARLRRRAEAAKLLFETLTRHRDAARRAYVAPLRDQMTRLGRVIFGDSLELDLTEGLEVASRSLNGRTVPFGSLSAGTREQLAIIERLAASILVARDGGAPVILDDALGYSDESRLAAMGAVLGLAGRDCQVVVLTCYPERYGQVAGARVVTHS